MNGTKFTDIKRKRKQHENMWKQSVARKLITCAGFVYFFLVLLYLKSNFMQLNTHVQFPWSRIRRESESIGAGVRKLAEITENSRSRDADVAVDKEIINLCRLEESLDNLCPSSCVNTSNYVINENEPNPKQLTCQLKNLIKHCGAFKTLHGYDSLPITEEEQAFPLAFTIKLHDNPEQTEQLFRTLYRPHNIYCFHVDLKADNRTFEVIEYIGKCFENVIVIKDRENMVFSSFAHVSAELKCMKATLKSSVHWKYYINLAGSDFPLRTNLEMVKILKFFNGLNDIETYNYPVFHSWRYENSYKVENNGLVQVGKKTPLKYDIKLSMGSPFGLFARAFVEFIQTDVVAQDIIAWFSDTFAPVEGIWATLVTLPWLPGSYPITVRHMINSYVSRAMIVTGDSPRCYGRYLRGQCLFSCGDLPWLKTRPEFIASKFDYHRDQTTLHCLEKWYRQRAYESDGVKIDWNYYNKRPHLKHHRNVKQLYTSKVKMDEMRSNWIEKNTRA